MYVYGMFLSASSMIHDFLNFYYGFCFLVILFFAQFIHCNCFLHSQVEGCVTPRRQETGNQDSWRQFVVFRQDPWNPEHANRQHFQRPWMCWLQLRLPTRKYCIHPEDVHTSRARHRTAESILVVLCLRNSVERWRTARSLLQQRRRPLLVQQEPECSVQH